MNPDFDSVRPRRVCVMIKPVFRPIRSVGMFFFRHLRLRLTVRCCECVATSGRMYPTQTEQYVISYFLLFKWFASLRAMFSALITLHRKAGRDFEKMLIYGFCGRLLMMGCPRRS